HSPLLVQGLVADSWIDTTIGVKVPRDSVLEVVDRDSLGVLKRIVRGHQEVRLADREQFVCDASWFPEKLCLQRIENERQEELSPFGLSLVTSAEPLVNSFIPGQVEFEREIGFRQIRDRDRSKISQDLVEDLLVEALAWPSIRQHRERGVRIRQNPQTSVLT